MNYGLECLYKHALAGLPLKQTWWDRLKGKITGKYRIRLKCPDYLIYTEKEVKYVETLYSTVILPYPPDQYIP